ncbi:MAG: hypothetical protein ACJAV5_001056 [Vicingaceae bacterium]|jgi:hypothetical protein
MGMMKFKVVFFSIAMFLGCFTIKAQGYWEHYDVNSGLSQNQLTGVIIENEANIWLLSDFELSKFNAVTKQFGPIWNSSNSNLVGQNYQNLIEANGLIWFSHDNGLTAIDSGIFTNYNSSNGLLSNDIRDLTVDTSGNLWIASPQGVSHFNGTQFVHDTSVVAYHIAIDDSNRVFIVNRRFNIIFNNNGPFLTHQVYDGSSWTTPAVSGLGTFPVGLLNVEFHQTTEGIFVVTKDYSGGIYKLSYPFHFDSIPFTYAKHQQNSTRPFRINNIHIDQGGRKWIISDQDLVLFSTIDSSLSPHHMNPEVDKYPNNLFGKEIITSKGRLTFFACNNGISLGYDIQQPSDVTKELNSNLIRTSISSLGPLFHDLDNRNALFEFPSGNGTHGIYQAQFIHTHKKSNQNFYETNLVNLFERTHEIGPVSNKSLVDREWVIRITKSEIDQHIASVNNRGYSSPANIKNWPTSGNSAFGIGVDLAPFVDVDNDGCYNPDIGDYPYIKGDEALFWINHIDQFEYHGMLYAYNDSTNFDLQRTVFVDYTIINRDTSKYDSVRFGMYVDFDLGNPSDDYLGADTALNGFYVYNSDSFDEGGNGFGNNPPAVGVRFLSEDLDGFVSYSNGNSYNGTPRTSQDMYNYLQGKWKDGLPITSSGNGRNSGGANTSIMFTGNPSTRTGWTELGPPGQLVGDRRGIGSIPYFGLNLGEKKTISLAISYGVNPSSNAIAAAVPPLQSTWNLAKQQWDSSNTVLPSYVAQGCTLLTAISQVEFEQVADFKMFPNPSSGILNIETDGLPVNSNLRVFSSNGRLLFEAITNGHRMQFNFADLPQGMYFVQCGELSKKLILLKD